MKFNKLLLILLLMSSVCFSQLVHLPATVQNPTASSFSYPQSVFVDSQNGHIWVTDFSNNRVLRFDVSSFTAIDQVNFAPVKDYSLWQNFPNPFNPTTQISFLVKNCMQVSLKVYDALGQEVAVLFNKTAAAGNLYSIPFNAAGLCCGIYICVLSTSLGTEVIKMCLLK